MPMRANEQRPLLRGLYGRSPRWAVARSPGGHAGALAFCYAGRGAVRQRTTPPRRGCRRTLHRSDHFCRTLWNATSGFELTYTLRLGSRGEPMPTQARKTGVGEARQDRPPAREKHAFDLGERWLGSANKVDYLIRRRLIPDHPCESDRAFARAPPFRYSSPDRAWEFAPMTLHPATRGNAALHELQAAIGRCLRAEYDFVISEPIPDRLMTLLRQAG